ncbi:HNH endonuclease signature motif containing protein [Heyndrickxia oleronia]|uniref:HNH endonuclease n=1 Tax=Heyndrickxia oleronia TaxID=38875 RepID=A0A8E2IBL0_9BACI|nr:HNH endonuclease signature motif containing protein [Heyndrickxia oleronia]MEC1377342.1 HNH endonuclease signature motif containing protein [Heyndrickxia oleronia]OOP70187.1 HNH endonuclease [Heyndrickxia oleronia]QQZ05983.1 HNH endonuclease [Heyndrickxia oleronia]
MGHSYTPEQAKFIRENVKGRTSMELTQLVNDHFGLNLRVSQIRAYMKNNGLKNGINTRYKKGNTPFNKGKRGITTGGISTQFKKGQKSINYKPIGTERIDDGGYILIKVSDDGPWHKRWRPKHQVVWEEKYGPVPKGHCLIFLDSNKQNISLENLQLITRVQLGHLNQNHLISINADLTKTGIIIAEIYAKMGERKKQKGD